MHPVRETSFVLADNAWVAKSRGAITTGELESVYAIDNCLSYSVLFNECQHPQLRGREGYVLPRLGVQVSRFEYRRERTSDDFDYYVDIVRVSEQGERWTVRDLYLDVLIFDGERAEILDTDEYLAAIREGHLEADEAAYALESAHALLNKLATFGYSLEAYLHSEGVTLTWHRLKSTR